MGAAYHIRTNIPILHSLTRGESEPHLHSLELSLYLFKPSAGMLNFNEVESEIDRCLAPYKNQYLNALPEFKGSASIEQIGEVFYVRLQESVAELGLILRRFEIGETPLRLYIIRQEDGEEV